MVNLAGLNFDDLDVHEAVQEILTAPQNRPFSYVVTPNVDHIARLRRSPKLRLIYETASLCLLDSRVLRIWARLLGKPVPRVATGADITAQLLAALEPQTVAIIGLDPAHLPLLQARYPHLTFLHHAPPMKLLNQSHPFTRACEFALTSNARFTFIALGSPLQEFLAYSISQQPNAKGTALCVGAALEFCAGAKRRAPLWMQHSGFEWLHRLLQEPRRLTWRYLVADPPVLIAMLHDVLRQKMPQLRRRQPLPVLPDAISQTGPYPPQRRVHLQKIPDAR